MWPRQGSFGAKGWRLDHSRRATVLYTILSINTFVIIKLLLGGKHKIDPATGQEDISFYYENLGLCGLVAVLAVICFFLFKPTASFEEKWGGRIIATVLPICGVLIYLFLIP